MDFASTWSGLYIFICSGALLSICSARPMRGFPQRFPQAADRPGVGNCTLHYFPQTIDHFGLSPPPTGKTQFSQRYFLCGQQYRQSADDPIFFYVGNEADVTLYVNATGLMWESAAQFNALMVFAEHRYFGESLPFGNSTQEHMQYLSTEQALADYATLIFALRGKMPGAAELPHGAPVNSAFIGFGGSYGGMLGSWLRMKYPSAIDGVVAGSAPILSFLGEEPPYDQNAYAKIVTYDASTRGGASDACAHHVRAAWKRMFELASTPGGREQITEAFHLCPDSKLNNTDDVFALAVWGQSSMEYMSMGSYPYPSSYILNGDGMLPAYPMREMCTRIEERMGSSSNDRTTLTVLEALREGVGVFYNYTKRKTCFSTRSSANNATTQDGLFWDFLYCAEMMQPFERNGEDDMFFQQPFVLKDEIERCEKQWHITPRPLWATINYGGRRLEAASNIVWSNGELDPWRGGGVTTNLSDSLAAIVIPDVGHHMDLMFSDPRDPPGVQHARDFERMHIQKWIDEVKHRQVKHRFEVGGDSVLI